MTGRRVLLCRRASRAPDYVLSSEVYPLKRLRLASRSERPGLLLSCADLKSDFE